MHIRNTRNTNGTTVLGMLVAVVLAAFVAASAEPPVAGQSAAGPARTGSAAERPARIISLIPAVTEMLFAIDAGPQVVAVGSFDRFPPEVETLPRVGALLDPDLERIFSLRPDLVVVYGTQTELREQLDRAGVPQFVYKHATLRDVTVTIRELGVRVGRATEGERTATAIEARLDGVRRKVAGRARPRTLLVMGREAGSLRGIIASGGFGFLHDMLEIAGGANLLSDVARESVQATSELILARRPEVILEVRGSGMTEQQMLFERGAWTTLSSVPAVRDNRIHIVADQRAVVPGPRVAEGTELIARALHGIE